METTMQYRNRSRGGNALNVGETGSNLNKTGIMRSNRSIAITGQTTRSIYNQVAKDYF